MAAGHARAWIGLEAIDGVRKAAQPLEKYHPRNEAGELIQGYEFGPVIGKYGDTGTLSRAPTRDRHMGVG